MSGRIRELPDHVTDGARRADTLDLEDQVLAELVSQLLGDHAGKALLKGAEVAEVLGMGRTAVGDAMRRGDLPSVRLGRLRFCPTAALVRWMLDGTNGDDPGGETGVVVALTDRADQGAHDEPT